MASGSLGGPLQGLAELDLVGRLAGRELGGLAQPVHRGRRSPPWRAAPCPSRTGPRPGWRRGWWPGRGASSPRRPASARGARRRAARGPAHPAGRAPARSRAPCGPAPARRHARGPSPGRAAPRRTRGRRPPPSRRGRARRERRRGRAASRADPASAAALRGIGGERLRVGRLGPGGVAPRRRRASPGRPAPRPRPAPSRRRS